MQSSSYQTEHLYCPLTDYETCFSVSLILKLLIIILPCCPHCHVYSLRSRYWHHWFFHSSARCFGHSCTTNSSRSVATANSSTVVKPFIPAKFDVPLLEDDGKNYDTWYVALQLVFENRDIWPVVNGTEPCLDQTTDLAGYTEWGFKDREARLIVTFLGLHRVHFSFSTC